MLSRTTGAALAAIAVIAPAADAAAEPTARVEYTDAFTTRTPGSPTGRAFYDEFFDAKDPQAKPPAVQHFHLRLPPGARFDTSAVPACGATDAELMAQGAAACQPGSEVGREVFQFDTGFEANRIVTNDITFLNDPGELIILTQERETGTRVVVRGKLTTETLDFDLAPLPGTPPEGGADRREDARYPVSIGPSGRAWLTTPPVCPESGRWTFRVDYTFRNGEKVTKRADSPCDRTSPPLTAAKLTFFRGQHARAGRPGAMRVRSSAATAAELRVAGRTRRVALQPGLNRVKLPALRRGSYRLTLTPVGGADRRATLRVR